MLILYNFNNVIFNIFSHFFNSCLTVLPDIGTTLSFCIVCFPKISLLVFNMNAMVESSSIVYGSRGQPFSAYVPRSSNFFVHDFSVCHPRNLRTCYFICLEE